MSTNLIQGSEDWLSFRKKHIGSSDAPVIMGVSPWKTPYQLWQEKTGFEDHSKDTTATRYGKQMEPVARSAYETETKDFVSTDPEDTIVIHKEIPFLMASLDGIAMLQNLAIEIKNCNEEDHDLARYGLVPEKYLPQVQHQLACTGHMKMHYCSYHKGELIVVNVYRDDKYITKLLKKEVEFWEQVKNLEPPKLQDGDYIQKGHDENWVTVETELLEILDQLSVLEAKEKELREKLKVMADGQNIAGKNMRFQKIMRPGNIDYKAIPELGTIDLEQYRKNPIVSYRVDRLL